MIDFDPWGESHAPKKFERTDRSGRYSPIEVREEKDWPIWTLYAVAAVFILLFVSGV